MKRFLILAVSLVVCAWGVASGFPGSGINYFLPQYPPGGPGITIDAKFDDWGGYPDDLKITVDQFYVHAGDDMDLDPQDFDATIMWCWHDGNNYLYAATEQFDDIFNAIPTKGWTETYQYDDMEMTTDADNSGGRYQYGDMPEDQWGTTGQQWGFGPTPEPYHLIYRISGATWMIGPPYSDYWAIVTKEATGTRIHHELYMVMWDYLSPVGVDQSVAHDLEEGQTIGATFYFDDYDETLSQLSGQWKTHQVHNVPHIADGVPDVHLLGSQAWTLVTAVSPASWGSIKATFAK
jgi:hypothetical protein